MKNIKIFVSLALAMSAIAFSFSSCDKNPSGGPHYVAVEVNFDEVDLPEAGYDFSDHEGYGGMGVDFAYTYTASEWGASWSGFAVSNNTDMTTAGFDNQFSVYGGGGAEGSEQFAVASIFGDVYFQFAGGANRQVEYAWFNNATYAALSMMSGDDYAKKFEAGDWFLLTATGYDADGAETGDVEVWLADFRDGKNFIMSDWTRVSLLPLGEVNKVSFALSSSDVGQYGMNTPAYFCIDNIVYNQQVWYE